MRLITREIVPETPEPSGTRPTYRIVLQCEGEPAKEQEVNTVLEAGRALRAFVEHRDLGASDLARGCGMVIGPRGPVAHVSYNGRVWTPDYSRLLDKGADAPGGTDARLETLCG